MGERNPQTYSFVSPHTNSPHLKQFSVQFHDRAAHRSYNGLLPCCCTATLSVCKDTHDLILSENLTCPETKPSQNKSRSSLCLHAIPFQLILL